MIIPRMGCKHKHVLFCIAFLGFILLVVPSFFMGGGGGGHAKDDGRLIVGETRFINAIDIRQAIGERVLMERGERVWIAIREAIESLLDLYYYYIREGGRGTGREYYIENSVKWVDIEEDQLVDNPSIVMMKNNPQGDERDGRIGERVIVTSTTRQANMASLLLYDMMKGGERVWNAIMRQASRIVESLLDLYLHYYEGGKLGRGKYYIENGVKWVDIDHHEELVENPSIVMMKKNPQEDERDEREGRIGERVMTSTTRQANMASLLLYDIMKGGERVLNAIMRQASSIVESLLDLYLYYYEGGKLGIRGEYYNIENGVKWVDPDDHLDNGLVEDYPSTNVVRDNQMGCNESSMDVLVVDPTGFGDYTTVQSAINGAPKNSYNRLTILVAAGTYFEKILIPITKPCITLQGQGKDNTTISWNDTANSSHGTRWSSTMAIEAVHFIARNISFRNTAPPPNPGVIGGQAIALRVSNDQAAFYGCGIYGAQDTLNDDRGRHYFKDCYIEGSIDFIFGDARSLYENCDIHSIANPSFGLRATGSITAHARRSADENTGFVFLNCTIFGTGLIWLGRSWGPYAITIFAYTYMSEVIVPTGWNDWNDPLRDSLIYFGEYMCSGPGSNASQRVQYSTILNDTQASIFINRSFIDSADWLLDWDSKSMLSNKRYKLENMNIDGYNSSSDRFIL